jgi:YD repeat-containing protein
MSADHSARSTSATFDSDSNKISATDADRDTTSYG